MGRRAGPVGHPAWDIPRPSVTHRPFCPRDSQFKHAETPEEHPASRRLGLSVTHRPFCPRD
eukprot:319569-Chlamydomonas_euryale.AAC.1